MQTIINDNGIKEESNIERLLRIRHQYYIEMMHNIEIFRIRLRQQITNYRMIVKQIDEDIERQKKKDKLQRLVGEEQDGKRR